MGMTSVKAQDHLTRAEIWSTEMKDVLMDMLEAQKWVDWMTEFPDGTQFNIPSIGQATTQDVVENESITYEALDTGEFNFQITEYIASAHYITRKALQDSFYGPRVLAAFVPKESRALAERIETDILRAPSPSNSQGSGGQTSGDTNSINGLSHRWVGSDSTTVSGKQLIQAADFAKAKLSLKKSNVPLNNLIAIVDPSVAYFLETATNLVNVSNNPRWEGIITSGLTNGMRFVRNVYGFDCYESNYLDVVGAETIGSDSTDSNGVQNLFFSAENSVLPIVGAFRQPPIVDSEFNKDKQREEYVTTARYGIKLFRPENMVCVLSDSDAVS